MKKNCWEFKKCGREASGEHADDQGICPVAYDLSLDGIHDGICAGRACWAVDGTLCSNHAQGTINERHKSCWTCDFYTYVREQEGDNLVPTFILLEILDEDTSK